MRCPRCGEELEGDPEREAIGLFEPVSCKKYRCRYAGYSRFTDGILKQIENTVEKAPKYVASKEEEEISKIGF